MSPPHPQVSLNGSLAVVFMPVQSRQNWFVDDEKYNGEEMIYPSEVSSLVEVQGEGSEADFVSAIADKATPTTATPTTKPTAQPTLSPTPPTM